MKPNLSGITHEKCPAACNAERCVISTVAMCKHPLKSGSLGCGPITRANRLEALEVLGISLKRLEAVT